ncbi:GGDEF domain-containing protein [Leeia aquatica]|uniref:diguanylate cyclase n=1 Tax=Leeia aquatica TaxID=2725557 RepID=A0A847SFW6_9NEIS|nr:diguanylate cyclase [Leeia aquatica]NLR74842.1 GGDEF domain-containing protein [Leeia aquatica]
MLAELDLRDNPYAEQRRKGFRWLKFDAPLEEAYLAYLLQRYQLPRRIGGIILTLVLLFFLAQDIHFALTHYVPTLSGALIALRLICIAAIQCCAWIGERQTSPMQSQRWIIYGLLSLSLCTLASTLLYQPVLLGLGIPVALDTNFLLLIAIFFPIGHNYWNAVKLALLVCISSWLMLALMLSPEAMPDFWHLLPYQVTALLGLAGMRFSHDHATRAQFLTRGILNHLAGTDGLTGLLNRRAFELRAQQSLQQAQREHKGTALLLMDVDHFKAYNDLYGHPAGDQALRQIGQLLQQQLQRGTDLAARLGGEEFAILLHDCSAQHAQQVARRIIHEAEHRLAIPHAHSNTASHVTLSLGYGLAEPGETLAELYQRTDFALYRAKSSGRNRAEAATPGSQIPFPFSE